MDEKWFAVYTRSRFEKKISSEFEKRKIEYYLPLYDKVSKWVDRKKIIREPLFKSYIFVHIHTNDALKVLMVDGVVTIVGRKDQGYASVPEEQIETIKIVLNNKKDFNPYPYLKEGERVRVVKGPLKGAAGRLIRKKDVYRIVVSIDLIQQAVSAEIDADMVEAF